MSKRKQNTTVQHRRGNRGSEDAQLRISDSTPKRPKYKQPQPPETTNQEQTITSFQTPFQPAPVISEVQEIASPVNTSPLQERWESTEANIGESGQAAIDAHAPRPSDKTDTEFTDKVDKLESISSPPLRHELHAGRQEDIADTNNTRDSNGPQETSPNPKLRFARDKPDTSEERKPYPSNRTAITGESKRERFSEWSVEKADAPDAQSADSQKDAKKISHTSKLRHTKSERDAPVECKKRPQSKTAFVRESDKSAVKTEDTVPLPVKREIFTDRQIDKPDISDKRMIDGNNEPRENQNNAKLRFNKADRDEPTEPKTRPTSKAAILRKADTPAKSEDTKLQPLKPDTAVNFTSEDNPREPQEGLHTHKLRFERTRADVPDEPKTRPESKAAIQRETVKSDKRTETVSSSLQPQTRDKYVTRNAPERAASDQLVTRHGAPKLKQDNSRLKFEKSVQAVPDAPVTRPASKLAVNRGADKSANPPPAPAAPAPVAEAQKEVISKVVERQERDSNSDAVSEDSAYGMELTAGAALHAGGAVFNAAKQSSLRQKRNPRLHFSKSELADRSLDKPVCKASKAAVKAEQARKKVPKKTAKIKERVVDPVTGKRKTRLRFEEIDKPAPSSKLRTSLLKAPSSVVKDQVHHKVSESEQDNVGVESVHETEKVVETAFHAGRSAYRSHKLRPYSRMARSERRLEKANLNALKKSATRSDPQFTTNPISRWQQRRAIKKQYAEARRAAYATGKNVVNSTEIIGKASAQAKLSVDFIRKHSHAFLIVLALLVAASLLLSVLSSCSMMLEGFLSVVANTTFPSEDSAMTGAEDVYADLEADLQDELDNFEALHPGYDEYVYNLDEIGHDPYVLVSILSAMHHEFTVDEVRNTMDTLFDEQYTLDIEVRVETRTSSDGSTYTVRVCYVTLTNNGLSQVATDTLDDDTLQLYNSYMATLGNRPDLFPNDQYANSSANRGQYQDYDIPPEALADAQFAAMINEAEKYLGYPYVFGGSSPSTSFDCSGFVCWVINNSGVGNVGRTTAQGLYNSCTPVSPDNAKPGDLIFFSGTYNTSDTVTHVGIFVGGNTMLHCGNPISYASINSSYWQGHFYNFGRL